MKLVLKKVIIPHDLYNLSQNKPLSMINTKYKVKMGEFEGPLDLLLDLIEKRKLLINDITLSKVTDDFIVYIKDRSEFPLGEIADFIVIASTLLLIKSKSLLPVLDLTQEEEENIEDLENRLKEYKLFRDLGRNVERLFGRMMIFGRPGRVYNPLFYPTPEISRESILEAIRSVILDFPQPERLPLKTIQKVISLEETIENLLERISKSFKTSFKEFSGGKGKETIIISFLAVLELVKRGLIETSQSGHFDEIDINSVA